MNVEALGGIVTNVGTFFTGALGWMGEALEVVVEHPALFVMVLAMPIGGYAVGLLTRLIRL